MIPFVPDWALPYAGIAVVGIALGAVFTRLALSSSGGGGFEELDLDRGTGFKYSTPVRSRGFVGKLLAGYNNERKRQKAIGKGHVRWYLVGTNISSPMYVKPERRDGGNVAEVEQDGHTYLFPEECAVPSAEDGVPVVMHREGEADPIQLGDNRDFAVDAKTLYEYLTLRVTSSSPKGSMGIPGLGFLANATPKELMSYLIFGIIVVFIALQVLG